MSNEVKKNEELIEKLVDWVRQYFSFELEWDVRLILLRKHVPKTVLGQFGQLGWTSWLGDCRSSIDAADLTINAEFHVTENIEMI